MSQYYPQQGPMYPPEQNPEEYYDEGDYEYIEEQTTSSPLQLALAFAAGGCLVFLCVGICVLFAAGLFLVAPVGSTTATAPEGSDIGLTFDEPAFPSESVVNDQGMQLTILEVNRNASLPDMPIVEGRETIIVTVELVNLSEEDLAFNERDFMLINDFQEVYDPVLGAVDGALGRGTLPPNEGLEGRLVFDVLAGEIDLRLLWDVGRDSEPRYIYLQ